MTCLRSHTRVSQQVIWQDWGLLLQDMAVRPYDTTACPQERTGTSISGPMPLSPLHFATEHLCYRRHCLPGLWGSARYSDAKEPAVFSEKIGFGVMSASPTTLAWVTGTLFRGGQESKNGKECELLGFTRPACKVPALFFASSVDPGPCASVSSNSTIR